MFEIIFPKAQNLKDTGNTYNILNNLEDVSFRTRRFQPTYAL